MRFAIVDPFLTPDHEKAHLLKMSCKTSPRVDVVNSVTTAVWGTAVWGTAPWGSTPVRSSPVLVNGSTAAWGSAVWGSTTNNTAEKRNR
jgi:hypothetical protein